MYYPIYIDSINMDLSIFFYFMGPPVKVCKFKLFLSVKIALILANCSDPDEMLFYVAFHLSLHCLPKYMYLFNSIQNGKG